MTTLEERLATLADDAPTVAATPGLWDRGWSLHRRRRRGTVAIVAAAIVAVSLLGLASWRTAEPDPAAPGGGMRLPDRLFDPSPWLSSTDDRGPLGTQVAVVQAERGTWWSTEYGLVGVSGRTGEYRFLDLPGLATGDDGLPWPVSLSPDGERIAYWYVVDSPGFIAGVAVYDTSSGDVERLPIGSRNGLTATPLLWSGDQIWFDVSRVWGEEGSGGSFSNSSRVWDPAAADLVFRRGTLGVGEATTALGDGVVSFEQRRLRVFNESERRPVRVIKLDRQLQVGPRFAPDGHTFAVLGDANPEDDGYSYNATGPLLIGRIRASDAIHLTEVPGVSANAVLGWRDRSHVVVQGVDDDPTYRVVDIASGDVERLGDPPPSNGISGTTVALDAWASPVFDAPEPPSPIDPRLRAGLLLGIIVATGLGLVYWRRRVRP